MADEPRKTLIVFVPGYAEAGPGVRLRGYVRWAIENATAPANDTWTPPSPELRAFQGYSGLRYTRTDADGAARYVDILEVPWQTEVTKLTSRPPQVRLWRGVSLLWLNFWSGLKTLRSSRAYAIATGIALALLVLWLLFLAMSLAGGVEQARKGAGIQPLPWIPPAVKAVWHAVQPKGWFYFIVLAVLALLAFSRIDPGVIADIADLYDRFTHDRPEPESYETTQSTLTGLVRDALRETNDGSYERVVVLGHSFGALIACAAVAQARTNVELITVGTYFSYLDNLDPTHIKALFDSVLAAPIVRWIDFFSKNDWLASSRGYHGTKDPRYVPRHADLKPNIGFGEKMRGESHRYYFEDVKVLKAVFDGVVPPA